MFRKTTLLVMGVVVGLSLPAYAFQEQTTAPVTPEQKAVAPVAEPAAPDAALAPATAPKAAEGTEVRIPGLGKLGVLPKMDFGLELLYGASEGKQPQAEPEDQPEDLTIRGTVKHNF